MLCRVAQWFARVLLGLFVVWQLAFLLGLNFCELTRGFVGSLTDAAETLPSLADPQSPAARRLARVEQVLTRWSEFTGQTQSWSLFAPNVWSHIPFVAVELRWDEEPSNARAAAGLVAGLAGPGFLQSISTWAATATLPPVLLLSDNEPRDIQHYFRVGLFRLRRYESNVDVGLPRDTDNEPEDMHDKWRNNIFHRVRGEAMTMRAYLEWKWNRYQAEHPDADTPRQVILHVRVYRIPPPPGPRPWMWSGPEDHLLARWRPHFRYLTGTPPVEVHDLIAERYDVLP